MTQLVVLALAAFLAYKYKDQILGDPTVNPGSSSVPVNELGPDYTNTVQAATGLPPSNGITPGVLPDGSVRILPPATPAQATSAASGSGTSYTPVVIDGNWTNAPQGAATAIQQAQMIATENRGLPQILPPPTPEMISELRQGRSMEEILGAAAVGDIFNYGGFSAWEGYLLPISAWNWYANYYRPGSGNVQGSDVISASAYNDIKAARGVSGLGCVGCAGDCASCGASAGIGAVGIHSHTGMMTVRTR